MRAEVIAIGDELTSGVRLDTNSQWLSSQLEQLGIRVLWHSTVGDHFDACVEVMQHAAGRADIVIITGGLGPTADDLTRQALAAAQGVELVRDEALENHIRQLFTSRNRQMPEKNLIQAMFPDGATPINNAHGTAPGIDMKIRKDEETTARFFALPGVPAEMKAMWVETVEPEIAKLTGATSVIRHRSIKCFGAGESHLESMLPDLIARGRHPSVGITVHAGTITLRITAQAADEVACEACMQPTIDVIHEKLKTLVFGNEEEELQDSVVKLLTQQNTTLATAEDGTNGLLTHWLSDTAGAWSCYQGGKTISIGNNKEAVALLAAECREEFGADYGLAIGPIAEIANGTETTPYYYALAGPDETITRSSTNSSHPAIVLDLAAKKALNLLRLKLLKSDTPELAASPENLP